MRSSELSLSRYKTDKVENHYLEEYDKFFEPWLDQKVVLLELGVKDGGSLSLWHDYFPLSLVVGIDIRPPDLPTVDGVRIFKGSQDDRDFLSRVANEVAPEGFDIIIDDASHIGRLTKVSFWHLFDNHLKPGGLYAIEDWGTGYLDDWPDGRSLDMESRYRTCPPQKPFWLKIKRKLRLKTPEPGHSYGMVGFVKQLIDEQGAANVTKGRLTNKPARKSRFENITFTPGIVFVKKVR